MGAFSRRDVLLAAASAPAALAAPVSRPLPKIRLGPHSVSRLIVGGNPVSANSHLSAALDSEMRDYFTAANVKKLLAACERAGIDTWQSRGDRHILRVLHEYRLEGGRIQWIAQTASEYGDLKRNLQEISARKPIGIYHHGSQTDKYWYAGKIDQAYDALKAIRQTGAQVGLGTHIPEVVDYAESKGWDFDFYMTCVYQVGRSPEDAAKVAGRKVDGELFWDADREKMLARVSRTARPCLIFKIYGATRHCGTPAERLAAVKLAFRYAKPGDAVVIGMFPKYQEQVQENCRLVMQALSLSQAT
jgi:hypothetical protein